MLMIGGGGEGSNWKVSNWRQPRRNNLCGKMSTRRLYERALERRWERQLHSSATKIGGLTWLPGAIRDVAGTSGTPPPAKGAHYIPEGLAKRDGVPGYPSNVRCRQNNQVLKGSLGAEGTCARERVSDGIIHHAQVREIVVPDHWNGRGARSVAQPDANELHAFMLT